MTLGNMREFDMQNLIASCLNDACRHVALIDVSSLPADTHSSRRFVGRSRLAEVHKPAAEGGVPSGPLLARVGKLGSHIGKLGSERGDDQLVMIDDRLTICGRFERRVGLDGMCGGHPHGHRPEAGSLD